MKLPRKPNVPERIIPNSVEVLKYLLLIVYWHFLAGATEGKVQLDQFKQVVQKTAEESKVGADQVLDMVRDHGNSFVGTVAGSAKKLGNLLLKDKKE